MSHSELLPIPPIDTATDPVHSASDLRERWRALMGPLGFGERLLWIAFVGPDRRLVKAVHQVVLNAVPRARICKNIMLAMHSALDDMAPGTAVAMLLTGPGRGPASPAVRLWAKSLTEAAERFAVPMEPMFSANDECLLHVEPA